MSPDANGNIKGFAGVGWLPADMEPCERCEGRGGGYNGEDGTEWECPDCWGTGKPSGKREDVTQS